METATDLGSREPEANRCSIRFLEPFRMARRLRRPPVFGNGHVSITLHGSDEPRPIQRVDRTYSDAKGLVSVSRFDVVHDLDAVAREYTYNGQPILDVPATFRGNLWDNPTIERRIAGRTLAQLAITDVSLVPMKPPRPDVFADSPTTGPIAIETTQNVDPTNREFQIRIQDFAVRLTTELVDHRGVAIPDTISIGFVAYPATKDVPRLVLDVADRVVSLLETPGTYTFPEIGQYIEQIQICKGGKARVEAASVVNYRGLPDYYGLTIDRIDEKQRTNYETDGRPLWLIVGVTVALLGPDVAGVLYRTNIELGRFTRVVLTLDTDELLTFDRAS